MPKYKVLVRPSGCINGRDWPEVGGILEVDADLSDMVDDGALEVVKAAKKVEKRPAVSKAETRKD